MYWCIEEIAQIDETGFGEMVYEPAVVKKYSAPTAQDASSDKEVRCRAFDIHPLRGSGDGPDLASLLGDRVELPRESGGGATAPA